MSVFLNKYSSNVDPYVCGYVHACLLMLMSMNEWMCLCLCMYNNFLYLIDTNHDDFVRT